MAVMLRTRAQVGQKKVETSAMEKVIAARTDKAKTLVLRTSLAREEGANQKFAKEASARKRIDEQLKLISKAEHQIDEATQALNDATETVHAILNDANLLEHTNGVHLAKIVEQWSNQKTFVDPKSFRAKVNNEIFWSSIDVALGKARQHLTEKELLDIADVTPGQLMGKRLKIERCKIKTRTK